MIRIIAALALVLLAIIISRRSHLEMERELLVATVRALLQMAAVAVLINLVFAALGWSVLLLALMLVAACR